MQGPGSGRDLGRDGHCRSPFYLSSTAGAYPPLNPPSDGPYPTQASPCQQVIWASSGACCASPSSKSSPPAPHPRSNRAGSPYPEVLQPRSSVWPCERCGEQCSAGCGVPKPPTARLQKRTMRRRMNSMKNRRFAGERGARGQWTCKRSTAANTPANIASRSLRCITWVMITSQGYLRRPGGSVHTGAAQSLQWLGSFAALRNGPS